MCKYTLVTAETWSRTTEELFYLAEYFCDQLADVLSPLGDVGVESVQVTAEAKRNHLEVIWAESNRRQVSCICMDTFSGTTNTYHSVFIVHPAAQPVKEALAPPCAQK